MYSPFILYDLSFDTIQNCERDSSAIDSTVSKDKSVISQICFKEAYELSFIDVKSYIANSTGVSQSLCKPPN